MLNFNNISVAKKIFSVTFIIFLSLVILSIYALQALNNQKNVTKSLYVEDLKKYRDISAIQLNIKEIQENVFRELNWYQAGYDDQMIDSIAKVIDYLSGEASISLKDLNKNTDKYKGNIEKIDSIYTVYLEWIHKVQDMASTDANISLIYMGNADNIFISLTNELDKIYISVEKGVEDSYKASIEDFNFTKRIFILIITISISISLIFVYIFSSQLIKSFKVIVTFLKDMAQGNWDLKKRLDSSNNDEFGQISNWIDNFINKLQDIIKIISNQTDMVFASSKSLTSSSNIMATSSKEVKEKVDNLKKSTDEANESINNISQNVMDVSDSIDTIASAIDEISATINEISKNCQREASITSEANNSSKNAVNVIDNLNTGINEIEKIIETINDIAEQTNMLALNASIEAASAGEAGHGFTVVANEVKALAKQTAKATLEIEKQISQIQSDSNEAVSTIRNVGEVIDQISMISTTIASSIEEQSITVNEISSNMNVSNNATHNISNNLKKTVASISNISSDVSTITDKVIKTNDETVLVRKQADDLKIFADKLNNIVKQFIV